MQCKKAYTKFKKIECGESDGLSIDGSGIVNHIWFCIFPAGKNLLESFIKLFRNPKIYTQIFLRFEFDDGASVSEIPLADFFFCGHGDLVDVHTRKVGLTYIPPVFFRPKQASFNSFWRMPFEKNMKLTFMNKSKIPLSFEAHITYEGNVSLRPGFPYFNIEFESSEVEDQPIPIASIKGHGKVAAIGLAIKNSRQDNRWHENPEIIDIDDQEAQIGTGMETFFGMSWGFRRRVSHPFYGVTKCKSFLGNVLWRNGSANVVGEFSFYKHLSEYELNFRKKIKIQIANNGYWPKCTKFNHIGLYRSSVFWYGRKTT